jgi:8-oxo-dGTP diphosphatase
MLQQDIKVAADTMVFSTVGDLQIVLVKRKFDPYKGMWALPGGFVEDDEELDAAAMRELHEETGLQVASVKQLHTYGKVGRDARGRTISVVHYTFADATKDAVTGGDDAAEAAWVSVKDIKELAFDHMEALDLALREIEELRPFR